jgi:hypothetical protein
MWKKEGKIKNNEASHSFGVTFFLPFGLRPFLFCCK